MAREMYFVNMRENEFCDGACCNNYDDLLNCKASKENPEIKLTFDFMIAGVTFSRMYKLFSDFVQTNFADGKTSKDYDLRKTFVPNMNFPLAFSKENSEFSINAEGAFLENVKFENCNITTEANFNNTIFKGDAVFSEMNVDCKACFENSKFLDTVVFDGTNFKCETCFENADFLDNVTFKNVDFQDFCNFERARFWRDVKFENCQNVDKFVKELKTN